MKILIATDGSEFSRAAVEECCDLLRKDEKTSVKIISAYEAQVPMAAEPFAISAEYYQRLDKFAEETSTAAANNAAEIVRSRLTDTGLDVTTVVELGRPAEMIIETAEAWHPDLIVVGSHGRGFWGRLALGSVSDAVLHHAPCSVLVVRKGAKK
jgi:nucleotide-binding universal stress UspA family protein